jgi:hypothetical protein
MRLYMGFAPRRPRVPVAWVTIVTYPGATPMRGATKTRSRWREWLEPVALEADAEDLVAVRVHERGGQEPVGPVDRDPALDALVGGRRLGCRR